MFISITVIALILSILAPGSILMLSKLNGKKVKTILGINVFSFFTILIVATIIMFSGNVFANPEAAGTDSSGTGWGFMAAAVVTGMATIGAGIAVASASSAALGAISEDPQVLGKALIFVALAEGIALYGLLVSFTILSRI